MKKTYLTFSGSKYHNWTRRIVEDAPKFGAGKILVYDDKWLVEKRPEFCKRVEWAFTHNQVRGFCWFCFKPFIFLDAMNRAEDGEILLFSDADTFPISDLNPLYSQCEKDGGMMFFSAVGHKQRHWCTHDTMMIMGQDDEFHRDQQHVVARFYLMQKGSKVKFSPTKFYPDGGVVTPEEFLTTWLDYCCDKRCNTFDVSTITKEFEDLVQHRTEQAILTNLVHRYGFKPYREACAFGNGAKEDWDIYPQVFEQIGSHSYGPRGSQCFGSDFANIPD